MKQSNPVYPIERIISALTYLTTGLAGFIWLIVAALLKKAVRPFLMYHIMQSIFISIAYFIFIELYKLVYVIAAKIPLINSIFFMFDNIINGPLIIFYGFSFLQIITVIIMLYLVITSFMGIYSYLPWISDIVGNNTGNR